MAILDLLLAVLLPIGLCLLGHTLIGVVAVGPEEPGLLPHLRGAQPLCLSFGCLGDAFLIDGFVVSLREGEVLGGPAFIEF